MKWVYGLLASGFALCVASLFADALKPSDRVGLLMLGLSLGVSALNVRCPRCKLHISGHRTSLFWPGDVNTDTPCPQCCRTRKGVWPYQYLVAPEPWDHN